MKPRETLDAIKQVAQLSGAIWAMEERAFNDLKARVEAMDLTAHVQAQYEEIEAAAAREVPAPKPGAFNRAGALAVIELLGPMTKYGTSLGPMRNGTIGARRAVRQAADSEDVSGILLIVDSPGGTVAGTDDLGQEVAAAGALKPVVAFVEDMAASAAYWVASQASRIVANRTALVGSIGTYLAVRDYSAADAAAGIKTHVIRAGEFKGLGIEGAPVTDRDIAEVQRVVNGINDLFIKSVADGRRVSRGTVGAKWADGRIYSGEQAEALGLIDAIGTREQVVAELASGLVATRQILYGRETLSGEVKVKTITNARAEWDEAIAAKVKAGMSYQRATSAVAKERPELREALIAEANEAAGRRRPA